MTEVRIRNDFCQARSITPWVTSCQGIKESNSNNQQSKKGGFMALLKKYDWPFMTNGWLTDFFDNDRFFDSDWMKKQSVPAVNVKETEKGFEVELAAPGMSKKDFNISVDNHVLTISSEKKEEKEEKELNYTRKEFSYTSFQRSFTLPENVSEENMNARYEDGVLRLSLIKKALPKEKARKMIAVS